MKKLFAFVLASLMLFATACNVEPENDTPLVSKDDQNVGELPVFNDPEKITWLLNERTITLPDGTVTNYSKFEYDEVGNVLSYYFEDRLSTYKMINEYNEMGYTEKEYSYVNGEEDLVTEFFYDENSNVIKILETLDGQTLGYYKEYDENNRLIYQTFTLEKSSTERETLKSEAYAYNDNGRLIEQIDYDANGNVTMHFYEIYDEQGRMIHRYSDDDQNTQSGFDYYYSTDENGNTVMSTKLRDHAAVISEETTDKNGKEIKWVSYNDKGKAEAIRETVYNENGDEIFCSYDYLPDRIDNEYTCTTEYDERGNIKLTRVVTINEGIESVTETTYNGDQRIEKITIDGELYSTTTYTLSDQQGYYTSYLYVDAEETVENKYTLDENLNVIRVETYTNGELTNIETLSWIGCKNYNPYIQKY